MYTISTAALVSILALVSSLAVLAQAFEPPTTGPRWVCTNTFDAPSGATCDAICQVIQDTWSISERDVENMNPGVGCQPTKDAPLTWCAQASIPSCGKHAAATSTKCTDGTQLKDWNISMSQFIQNNADVDDKCGNLKVGQQYCISAAST